MPETRGRAWYVFFFISTNLGIGTNGELLFAQWSYHILRTDFDHLLLLPHRLRTTLQPSHKTTQEKLLPIADNCHIYIEKKNYIAEILNAGNRTIGQL